jgi:hypothetical protein
MLNNYWLGTYLADAVFAFQVIAETDLDAAVRKAADINGSGKIGIEEAVYVLQHLGE